MQSLVTCQTCDLSIKESGSKATDGIHWCYDSVNGTGMFQGLPFLQPQLSATSRLASEHQQWKPSAGFQNPQQFHQAKRLVKLPGTKSWSGEKLI